MISSTQTRNVLVNSCSLAAKRAAVALLDMRNGQGYWSSELGGGVTLAADYVLLQLWLHPATGVEWNPPSRERVDKAVKSLLRQQLPDGGFNVYPKGSADVSATVKAYFALKLSGLPPSDSRMEMARQRVLALGGIQSANLFVKTTLSLFGVYPGSGAPVAPVEMMLAPGNVIYEMPSWIRAIVVPLSVIQAVKPEPPVPRGFVLTELFHPDAGTDPRKNQDFFSWRTLSLASNRACGLWAMISPAVVRRKAIRAAEKWIVERSRGSRGLAGIHPAMIYSIMAMTALGYGPDHPDRAEAERNFNSLIVDDNERFRVRPCSAAVWDTSTAAFAIGEAGTAPRVAFRRTAEWLLGNETRMKGDWAVKRPEARPGGWHSGPGNQYYPNANDTAMTLLALKHMSAEDVEAQETAARRAIRWLLAMQSADGGWAAFDGTNKRALLNAAPFAEYSDLADPVCADVTGKVLEALSEYGLTGRDPSVRQGVKFLIDSQEQDGSWRGRWGVNYLYGTFCALRGLRAAGEDEREAHVLRAGEWIRGIQNADGGWGESCESYELNCFAAAPSTPSQTAWAVMGLLASGDDRSESLERGIEYLLSQQRADGTWDEELATGAGFPGLYYIVYPLYRNSFPLLALASYLRDEAVTKGDLP